MRKANSNRQPLLWTLRSDSARGIARDKQGTQTEDRKIKRQVLRGYATMKSESTQFQKFNGAVVKILSVSHEELQRREAEWKKQRKRKKRAKT
jgi:hypothetical protein